MISFQNIEQKKEIIDCYTEWAKHDLEDLTNDSPRRFTDNPNEPPMEWTVTLVSDIKETYKDYLRLKYSFLLQKEQGKTDSEILKSLHVCDTQSKAIEEIFKLWDENFITQTSISFLLRYNQLGKFAIENWYNELEEFNEWSQFVQTNCGKYLIDCEDMGEHNELVLKLNRFDDVIRIEKRIVESFHTLLVKKNYKKKDYIREFVKIICVETNALLTDYLEVDNMSSRITYYIVSDDNINDVESQDSHLREEETYTKGHGITGSILVPDSRIKNLHVGSNNLDKDSRQSAKHESVYSKVYGHSTKNFWLFPLYDNDTLYGAFRVINKKQGAEFEYWTYEERSILIAIADWFPMLWRLVLSIISSYIGNIELYGNDSIAMSLIKRLDIGDLIKENYLGIVLAHLRSVVHRKVESRSMRVLFLFSKTKLFEVTGHNFAEYPMQDSANVHYLKFALERASLEDISLSYKTTTPNTAFFYFTSDGHFRGVRQLLSHTNIDGMKHLFDFISKYGKDDFIAFLTDGEKNCIRIVTRGEPVADYYLSENTGRWQLRVFADIEKMLQTAGMDEVSSKSICNILCDLSYNRVGSMFIITDSDVINKIKRIGKKKVPDIFVTYPEAETLLKDWASIDGAVVINYNGLVEDVGYIIENKSDDVISNEWKDRIIKAQKGARHTSAVAFSCKYRNACVAVVSENKGISILFNGEALMWNDEYKME